MKSRLLIGSLIIGMMVIVGCSNDTTALIEHDKTNSNNDEQYQIGTSKEDINNKVKDNKESDDNSNIKIEDIQVGTYIKYQPNSTYCEVLKEDSGYEKMQTYDPSSITSWKVFRNNNGQLDIISSESVGNLTLQGATGYAKAVDTLNKMCGAYVNPTYADSGRCLGYVEGNSIGTIDIDTYPLTWKNTYVQGNEWYPYQDEQYIRDLEIINTSIDADGNLEYPLRHSRGHVWLASRYLLTDSSGSAFRVRYLGSSGEHSAYHFYSSESNGDTYTTGLCSFGIRPVISLKSNLKIISGDGTNNNPYKISI